MTNICFVVEGYAEERFINEALAPYLQRKSSKQIQFDLQNLNGGILYSKLIDRLINLSPQYDIITTLIDLVALNAAKIYNYQAIMLKSNLTSYEKALQIESNLCSMINCSNFIPYVQPHEFEALCFADIDGLCNSDPYIDKNKSHLQTVLRNHNPEDINTIPSTYPAKRLEKIGYTKGATNFAKYCDIDTIRLCCPHFDYWLNLLVNKL